MSFGGLPTKCSDDIEAKKKTSRLRRVVAKPKKKNAARASGVHNV